MKIVMEANRETEFKFFLDGDKGILLDFGKCKEKDGLMLSTVHYLCENIIALEIKNNAYYIDDYKYLDKEEMLTYLKEISTELSNGVKLEQTYLCAKHSGKYSDIKETYKKLMAEINLKKYKIIGVPVLQYVEGNKEKENYVINVMFPIKIELDCYATKNARMKLDDKEYRQKYKKWLDLYWECIDTNPYVDPDMLENEHKRINPCFYADLGTFLNQRKGRKYHYTENDKFMSDDTGINFISDQFGFSAPKIILNHPYDIYLQKCKKAKLSKDKAIENVINWVMVSRTIGGSFLWPDDIWEPYNRVRGTRSYIQDRVDLTLLEIKHYLDNQENVEGDILKVKDNSHGQKWLADFASFEDYVDYFYLNPFVTEEIINNKKHYKIYDIVHSNIVLNKFKYLDEKSQESNSIFRLSAKNLEIMFNNLSTMIKKRSLMMTIEILNAKN